MPIYEQSVNVRKMSPVWWYTTWQIFARYVGIAAGLIQPVESLQSAIFGINLSQRGISP